MKSRRESFEQDTLEQVESGKDHFGGALASLSIDQANHQRTETRYQAKSVPEKKFSHGVPPIQWIDDAVSTIECDAGCQSRKIDGLWVCEYCEQLPFKCGQCLREFRRGDLSIFGVRCQRYHPHHRVYPIDEELKNRATKTVQERTLPRQEWLRALEAGWMPSKAGGGHILPSSNPPTFKNRSFCDCCCGQTSPIGKCKE